LPASPTYPGVYVQEIPSGSRTVIGVATSITAFVGRALRGPTNDPTKVNSFSDFTRKFGGLWARSPMTYAVRQYFLAGGTEALIVRVVDDSAQAAQVTLGGDDFLHIRARNVDEDTNDYGNAFTVTITHPETGFNQIHRFTLTLSDEGSPTATTEQYLVSMLEGDVGDGLIYIGDLPDAVAAGQIAEVLSIPNRRPPIMDGVNLENGSAAGAAWLSIPGGAALWLRASAAHASPPDYGDDITVTTELDHRLGHETGYTVTVTQDGVTTAYATTTTTVTTSLSGSVVEVLGYSRQRPEDAEVTFSGGTSSTRGTGVFPTIRGMRLQATADASPYGEGITVSITAGTTATRFDVVISGDPLGASPTVAATWHVTVDENEAASSSPNSLFYIGHAMSPYAPPFDLVMVTDYSGHVPDPTGGAVTLSGDSPTLVPPAYGSAAFLNTDEAPSIVLSASSEGVWGNTLRASIDHDVSSDNEGGLFGLTIEEVDINGTAVNTEVFRNVALNPEHQRYLGRILEEESSLVELTTTVDSVLAFTRLSVVSDEPFTGGTDGGALSVLDLIPGDSGSGEGLYALDQADLFNLLVLPPPSFDEELEIGDWADALAYCETRRAICIVDAPSTWTTSNAEANIRDAALTSTNGAIYFPWVRIADPLRENRLRAFPPAAVVAGLIAKTDAQRGVWKAPAGLDVRTPIVRELTIKLTDAENGTFNPLALNCLRTFPSVGSVIWGARTLAGADRLSSDWKYLPVRRLALNIEESLYRGMQWAVFEPNDEPLWGQMRLAAGGFMQHLFRQGAFKGATAKDAYFVKCDSETTTDDDIDRGIVNLLVGFAPLKPAEFVVISIQQIAGQVSA
jgi:hypothetical protein